jgi:hypothetical protein
MELWTDCRTNFTPIECAPGNLTTLSHKQVDRISTMQAVFTNTTTYANDRLKIQSMNAPAHKFAQLKIAQNSCYISDILSVSIAS